MELMKKEMERVGLNNKEEANGKTMLRTPADIFDHPSFYTFLLDMPGLHAQNIKVKVEKGILHVTGKKKKQQMGEGVKMIRVERRRARYMRKFTLPADATHEDVKATYKDGVLSIIVAKNQIQQVEDPNSNSISTIATNGDVSTITSASSSVDPTLAESEEIQM